jgi:hypothetical protein
MIHSSVLLELSWLAITPGEEEGKDDAGVSANAALERNGRLRDAAIAVVGGDDSDGAPRGEGRVGVYGRWADMTKGADERASDASSC